MKIEKLVIYGFGKHENTTIELHAGINVLYGYNESGKTTIQQFILHVLFGFPHRNSAHLRYEPKSGGKYGGQVHIQDTIYGKCIVERVRGKSAGDVNVYFEDGRIGNETDLTNLLRQYNRASFESIFSFSLLQLQDFEKMNEDELSRTLLASGTTGVDDLLKIEAKMAKEMDRLFKKQGRNPELNKKIRELRTLEEALQNEQKKSEEYAPTVQRLAEVDKILIEIQKEKESLEKRLRKTLDQKQQLPLHRKRARLKERLKHLRDNTFPTDGMQRYESIVRKLEEATARSISLQAEIDKINDGLIGHIDLDKVTQIEELLERESEWHRSLSTIDSLTVDKQQLIAQADRIRARLGIQPNEEETYLLTVDVSLRKEEELYELLEKLNELHREMDIVVGQLTSLQEEMNVLEKQAQYLHSPTNEELERANEWPTIQQKIAEAKAYLSLENQGRSQSTNMVVALFVIAILMSGYSFFTKQYGLLLISLVLVVIAFGMFRKQKENPKTKEMEGVLSKYGGMESKIEKILQQASQYEQEKKQLTERMSQIELESYQLEKIQARTNEDIHQTEQTLQLFLAEYGIDGLPSSNLIPELFRMIRGLQETLRKIEQVQQEKATLENVVKEQLSSSEQLLQQQIPQDAHYEWIRKEYKIIREDLQQEQSARKRKQQFLDELNEKEALVRLLTDQRNHLFQEAKVEHEEAYYKANQIQQEKDELKQQLTHLEMQLEGQPDIDLTLTDQQIDHKIDETNALIKGISQKQSTFLEEKAMLANKTNALLTDEKYSELSQQYEMERANFNLLAKQWASKKALATAIQQMMNDLQEKEFPKVIDDAERLFSELTNHHYESIVITDEGYFEVTNQDGIRFPIVELSQATKEQAYLSLRLALAISLMDTAPFPIIMDDPFVHFDEKRLSNIIEVIERLTAHQFIYFTCHKTLKDKWQHANIINVSTLGNKQGANVYEETT